MKLFPNCINDWFYRIDRGLHALKSLQLKFGLTSEFSEFYNKIPVKIFLGVLFRVSRFSTASFNALTSSLLYKILNLCRHLDTDTYGMLLWQFCNFTCEIINRPFYRYGGHIELIGFNEYYGMPSGHEHDCNEKKRSLCRVWR